MESKQSMYLLAKGETSVVGQSTGVLIGVELDQNVVAVGGGRFFEERVLWHNFKSIVTI